MGAKKVLRPLNSAERIALASLLAILVLLNVLPVDAGLKDWLRVEDVAVASGNWDEERKRNDNAFAEGPRCAGSDTHNTGCALDGLTRLSRALVATVFFRYVLAMSTDGQIPRAYQLIPPLHAARSPIRARRALLHLWAAGILEMEGVVSSATAVGD